MRWVDAARYGLGVIVVISVPPAIAWWFVVHPFTRFWRRLGLRASLWILGVAYAAVMIALVPYRGVLLGRDLGFSAPLTAVAVPLSVVSLLVQRARRKHLTLRILAGVPELSPERHATGILRDGIYGRIRHPRYVEFMVGAIAWSLFINYLGVHAMVAAAIAAILLIIPLEEKELRERFGQEYADYCARVPRLIPRAGSPESGDDRPASGRPA